MQFDWFLRMIYHRTDAKMTSPLTKCSFFLSQKQIDCTLTCVLTIKGIRRRQNFVRTSVTDSAASDVTNEPMRIQLLCTYWLSWRTGRENRPNTWPSLVRMTKSQIFSRPVRPNSVHKNFILTKQTSVATK